MKALSNRVLCVVFLAMVTVVMYLLNLFTPMFCDDWHYVYIWGTTIPIESVSDIL